jgi:hypothetical protein
MPRPIVDVPRFVIVVQMTGKADITARVAAISYTLVITAMVWFTFAFGGFEPGGNISGLIVFALLALSPIPVCIFCFRRH